MRIVQLQKMLIPWVDWLDPRWQKSTPFRKVALLFVLIILFILVIIGKRNSNSDRTPTGHPWSYEDPGHWTDEYSMCKGIRQSPINIDRESVEFDKNLEQFTFHGYSSGSLNMTLENNGHTAKVSLQGEINVSGGDLPMVYKAVQFHFHWGSRSFKGSEHTYDKKTYPMEMHIVHYAAIFDSFTDAAKYADGLAVLAFMFRLSRVDNPAFNKITDYLNQTEERNNCVDITPFPIDSLLPKEKASYFRYRGSLTTPPCSETVIWTVFAEPILISEKQLNHFRALKANSVQHLVDNFRPVQNLYNRKITKNFMSNPIGSTTALIPTVLPLYFFPVVALCVRI